MKIKDKLEILKNELCSTPIKIVAVTKFATVEQMIEAYEAGLRDFGENKLQTHLQKWPDLTDQLKKDCKWHFIGHLQTNKAKKVVETFDLIQSVDSLKLAQKISEIAKLNSQIQDILLEVNIAQEDSKFGFSKEDIKKSFPEIVNLSNVNVKGLMTMAPLTDNTSEQQACFSGLRKLRDYLQDTFNYQLPELSMGMSNDYKAAIKEGSTIIRIGQKLFS